MSALLLDTHTFIWFSENAPNLSVTLKEQIESADIVYISIASLWEIAIKISIGNMKLLNEVELEQEIADRRGGCGV